MQRLAQPAGHGRLAPLPPQAGDGRHPLPLEIDLPQQVILGIGDVQCRMIQGQALRAIEFGHVEVAVGPAHRSRADGGDQLAVEARDHDPVVVAVGDEQPAAGLVGQDLARETQGSGLGRFGQLQPQRLPAEQSFPGIVSHPRLEHFIDFLEGRLAAGDGDHVAFRVDQHQGRPGTYFHSLPEHVPRIVDHRMADLVAFRGRGDVSRILLILELRRVYADHHQLTGVGLFQLLQLRQDVHAIDAAIGPEIQQHELPAEVLQLQGPRSVDPLQARGKLGHRDPLAKRGFQRRHLLGATSQQRNGQECGHVSLHSGHRRILPGPAD